MLRARTSPARAAVSYSRHHRVLSRTGWSASRKASSSGVGMARARAGVARSDRGRRRSRPVAGEVEVQLGEGGVGAEAVEEPVEGQDVDPWLDGARSRSARNEATAGPSGAPPAVGLPAVATPRCVITPLQFAVNIRESGPAPRPGSRVAGAARVAEVAVNRPFTAARPDRRGR